MIKSTLAVVVISTLLLGCGDTGKRAAKAAEEALQGEQTEALNEPQKVEQTQTQTQTQVNEQSPLQTIQEPMYQPEEVQAVNTIQPQQNQPLQQSQTLQQTQVSPKPIKLEPAPPQPAIIEEPAYRIKTKKDGFIYMRSDRYSEAEKTHKLLDGTRVNIYECYEKEQRTDVDTGNIGRWCLAELQDGSTGYIFSSYVTPRID